MKNLVLIFSCLMAMCVMSCGDDATVNPPGDGIPGTIAGRVVLFDEYGDSLSNHSGVAVKLVNENKSYSAVTDAAGNYKLEKVIAGIYNLSFEKEGWEKYETREMQFVGNGTMTLNLQLRSLERKNFLILDVNLLDLSGNPLNDRSGVSLSIDGTSFLGTTDVTGRWKIRDLPTGEYSFSATKSGFDHVKDTTLYSFKHDNYEGNSQIHGITLIQIPNTVITLNSPIVLPPVNKDQGDSSTVIIIKAEKSNYQNENSIVKLFFGGSDVSSNNFAVTGETDSTQSQVSQYGVRFFVNPNLNSYREKEFLKSFPSGSQVYVRAYAMNPIGRIFTDPKTGAKRAVGFGLPSNVVSFTMP